MKNMPISNLADEHARGRSPYLLWLPWIVWLPLAIPVILNLFRPHASLPGLIVSLIGILLFFSIYLWISWRRAQQLAARLPPASDIETWLPFLLLVTLSVILILINGNAWLILFYFISGYMGGRLSTIHVLLAGGALISLIVALGFLLHIDRFAIGQTILMVCVIGTIGFSIIRSVTTRWELHAAQEEIARLAVTTERLRIARDLHDLLGHNLSLIALKSELARRLISVAPERAIVEISDVEQVARTTLQEVRDAVASYRQPTLPNELQSAQEILAAAGIAYQYEGDEPDRYKLPIAIEAVLAWTVREGVTNIIRHSRAHQCLIRTTYNKREVQLEIIDDGTNQTIVEQAISTSSTSNRGSGLRGLAERVHTLNGQFAAGPPSIGGFCLSVSLPLTQKAEQADKTSPYISGTPILSQASNHDQKRSE